LLGAAVLKFSWRCSSMTGGTAKRPHAATLYGGLVILMMQVLNNSPAPHAAAVLQLERWLAG